MKGRPGIIYMGGEEPSQRTERVMNAERSIWNGNPQEGPVLNPDLCEMHLNSLRYSDKI